MEDPYLLISDVDGTLLGDDGALEEFADWYAARRNRIRLVFNSGRLFESVCESVRTSRLPAPDAVIGGVGTQIRSFATAEPVGEWLKVCRGWDPLRICSVLARYDELQMQPAEFLSDHKISYFADDVSDAFLAELKSRLEDVGCRIELIYSSRRDLDVLPRGVNKGSAAAYLARFWSTRGDHVFVCGDSGNDRAMFENGFRGIVVANAHPELYQLALPNTYRSRRPYAAGVVEGVDYWMTV